MYATLDQARAAGATGTDEQVTAALTAARALVDSFTGEWWEPTPATVIGRVTPDRTVLLPYRVLGVDSVAPYGTGPAGATYPTTAYRWTSSEHPGGIDALHLGGGAYANELVVGAEPWVGGWANLFGRVERVEVVGTFGQRVPPLQVVDATAALAAWLRSPEGTLIPPASAGAVRTDDEGNAVTITVDTDDVAPKGRTTGLQRVDTLLAALVAPDPVRIN